MGGVSSTCEGDEKNFKQRLKNLTIVRKYFENAFYQYPYKINKPNLILSYDNGKKIELTNLKPISIDKLDNFNYFFQSRQETGSIPPLSKHVNLMGNGDKLDNGRYYIGKIGHVDVLTYILHSFDTTDKLVYLCLYKMIFYCNDLALKFFKNAEEKFKDPAYMENIKNLLLAEDRFKLIAFSIEPRRSNLILLFIQRFLSWDNALNIFHTIHDGVEDIIGYLVYNYITKWIQNHIFDNNNLDISKLETCNRLDRDNIGSYDASIIMVNGICPNFQILYATFMVPIELEEEDKSLLIDKFWKGLRNIKTFSKLDSISGEFIGDLINRYLYENLSSCNVYQIQVIERKDDAGQNKIREGSIKLDLLPYITRSIIAQFIFAIYSLHQAGISHNNIEWDRLIISLVASNPCYYYNVIDGTTNLYYKIESYGVELTITDFGDYTNLIEEKCVESFLPLFFRYNFDILMFGYLMIEFIRNGYNFNPSPRGSFKNEASQTEENTIIEILTELFGGQNLYDQLIKKMGEGKTGNKEDEKIRKVEIITTLFKDKPQIDLKSFFGRVGIEILGNQIPGYTNVYKIKS